MSDEKVINFMGQRKIAGIISIVLLVASIASLAVNGLNLGLDFTGGTLVELKYEQPANLNAIRDTLKEKGFPSASVVNFGSDTDVLIRMQGTSLLNDDSDKEPAETAPETKKRSIGDEVLETLSKDGSETITLKRTEVVGPQIGEELRDDGGIGMLFALIVVMAYVAIRFQFKFSVGAVSALIHDVILVLGIFSITQMDFDLTVLAAILAVIGYSLNDTIVVSDRIRENFRIIRKSEPVEVINISLTQTLGRTLITSLTTLLVLLALFFVGGELIHKFAIALIVGILVGTYSSIYVASNILLSLKISQEDLLQNHVEKEGEDLENLDEFNPQA